MCLCGVCVRAYFWCWRARLCCSRAYMGVWVCVCLCVCVCASCFHKPHSSCNTQQLTLIVSKSCWFIINNHTNVSTPKAPLVHVFEKKVIIPECRSTNQAVTFCERKVVMTAFEKVTKTSITRDISFKIKLMCLHMILLHSVIQVSEDG